MAESKQKSGNKLKKGKSDVFRSALGTYLKQRNYQVTDLNST